MSVLDTIGTVAASRWRIVGSLAADVGYLGLALAGTLGYSVPAGRLACFLAVAMALIGLAAVATGTRMKSSLPYSLDMALGFAATVIYIWSGWWVTGSVSFIGMIFFLASAHPEAGDA